MKGTNNPFENERGKAKFITYGSYKAENNISPIPLMFKKQFFAKKGISGGILYATALGIMDISVNGVNVSEEYFAPGFTSYKHTLQYVTYDLTGILTDNNEIEAVVGAGWACGRFTYQSKTQLTAKRPALMMMLQLNYQDGSTEYIFTDGTWLVSKHGNYVFGDFYDGEVYDATITKEQIKWENAVLEKVKIKPEIVPQAGEKVLRHEHMIPLKHFVTPCGKNAWDFGQNFAGVVMLKIKGKAGQKITVRHSEILAHGELCFNSLRTAKAQCVYICKDGEQTYSPKLTYMGFRYVEIEGTEPENIDVSAYAVYSDIKQTGDFCCSNPKLNRVQQNIKWGAKSNFVDIPTDCPQRDERQGWTGDLSVFCSTACYNFDMSRFFDKWLKDVRSEQNFFGGIPFIVPRHGNSNPVVPTACWGDSCLIVPYTEYMCRGDKEIIKKNYAMMKRYFNSVRHFAALFSIGKKRYIWQLLFQFGDWCAPEGGVVDWLKRGKWIGTAFYSYDCYIMANVAAALGYEEDSKKYRELKAKVDDAYMSVFTDGNGKLKNEFQTGYVLPLYFRMGSNETMAKMADNLDRMIAENGYHLSTGFTGTPFILFALCDNGKKDTAFKVLLQNTAPSWLYEIENGATTFWEGWRAVPPDREEKGLAHGESESGESFNHYAAGSVGDFLYRRVLGLEAITAGYDKFSLCPVTGGNISSAQGWHDTHHGRISVSWQIEGDKFSIEFNVPEGSCCVLCLPDGTKNEYATGNYNVSCRIGS